ncbi:MAG: acyl-CoA dehydrogenase family protein [Syntrophales bacterium]|jgi:butyryl-CoA dehydrogenase|nr:acyl-CoA dehydrogenase family protein [Syntrophales bacterium]MDY0043088.1 acyl-CoA dehydrogenase family protein [Syntrophales bacterium]
MNTLLSEKHRAIRKAVRSFCDRELTPIAAAIDQEARFPWEAIEIMGKLGYFGIQAPTELGGAGLDSLSYVVAVEEVSRSSGAIGLTITVHNSVAVHPILSFGTEDQKNRWIPPLARGEKIGAFCLTEPNAGSDASAIEATAIRKNDCYITNANKVFVSNGGVADLCLIFARTDPGAGRKGISVIVAERGTRGYSVGEPEDLSGMRANPVCSIRLYDCRIPLENLLGKEGAGLQIALETLDTGRLGIAAQATGISQAALEASFRYARERQQFGTSIGSHQAVQGMLADMATMVDAARLLVYRAAILRDEGKPFSREAAMAKLYASEISTAVTDRAVQIHGGYGYSKAYAVERYYRDARVTRIYEGTSEIHRMVIAKGILEEYP